MSTSHYSPQSENQDDAQAKASEAELAAISRDGRRSNLLLLMLAVGMLGSAMAQVVARPSKEYVEERVTAAVAREAENLKATAGLLTSSWRGAQGIEHEVSTPRKDGQSVAEWEARHKMFVEALQKVFPPEKQ